MAAESDAKVASVQSAFVRTDAKHHCDSLTFWQLSTINLHLRHSRAKQAPCAAGKGAMNRYENLSEA